MTARERVAGTVANYVDERTGAAKWMKKNLTKVFPDHWSFLLGEIVLYSFIILLLSGTFLTFWYDPSQREVIYDGSYVPLQDLHMSAAYASTLHISFEIRGGMLMRQIHHWAALIFMAGMVVHLMRVYFTGAFRKPREFNWMIYFQELVFVLPKQLFKRYQWWVHIWPSSPSVVHFRVKHLFRVFSQFTYCCYQEFSSP
jgi:ubiquinol-cytochrome c reductase cytochrome b subunit